tara:strand:- start:46316 stop:46741 length:426 start_codon:yes stop_codon:yes gene_type:complete
MKNQNLFLVFTLLLIFTSCTSTKKMASENLYNTTWELDYISGPRIAFTGLYPDKKPRITFNKSTQKVEGNNSCNGYSATYTLKDDTISFGEPGATTMMYCGEGEKIFLNTIKKVNKYEIDASNNLNLMIDDITMLRFKKIE